MKKLLFLMLFLTSCRSITMEDYQTDIAPFKYQDYEFTLNVPENIYVITQTNVGERAKIDNGSIENSASSLKLLKLLNLKFTSI